MCSVSLELTPLGGRIEGVNRIEGLASDHDAIPRLVNQQRIGKVGRVFLPTDLERRSFAVIVQGFPDRGTVLEVDVGLGELLHDHPDQGRLRQAILLALEGPSRGRNARYRAPPAQTPACSFSAPGSSVVLAFATSAFLYKGHMLSLSLYDPG